MAKVALLIGVGDYASGLSPLPAAPRDVAALKQVLSNPEMGNFDRVRTLIDPSSMEMSVAIETWFRECQPDDLVLLYFSGHGVKDGNRDLYFATCNTRKGQEEIIRATAVAASFVRDSLKRSRARRQVVILDCCFSGAFGDFIAKEDGEVDIEQQLGAEGWVVLTSSSSLQYSFEQKETELSIYTRFLVEGLRTGAADEDEDGIIAVHELHQYASKKVQEIAPAVMNPKIIVLRDEGFNIQLAHAPTNDPELKYRLEAQRLAINGKFLAPARKLLDSLRDELELLDEVAAAIEEEVVRPYLEYQRKLQDYEQTLVESLREESPLSQYTRNQLRDYGNRQGLRNEDMEAIEAKILSSDNSTVTPNSETRFPADWRYWFQPILDTARTSRWFWLQYFLATVSGGFAASTFVHITVSTSVEVVGIVIGGVILGVAQWFVLKKQIVKPIWWIPITTGGWVVGWAVCGGLIKEAMALARHGFQFSNSLDLSEAVGDIAVGIAVIETTIGLAQWLLLRSQFSGSHWWIAATVVSGVASIPTIGVVGWTQAWIASWAVFGFITGSALAWLLQHSRRRV